MTGFALAGGDLGCSEKPNGRGGTGGRGGRDGVATGGVTATGGTSGPGGAAGISGGGGTVHPGSGGRSGEGGAGGAPSGSGGSAGMALPGSGGAAGMVLPGSGGAAGMPGAGGAMGTGGRGSGGAGGSAVRTTFSIYWIDVEGGGATLLVAPPSGQTMLIDAGFAGNGDRDVNRVLSVVRNQAKATRLDYVVTTHYHTDHVGGVTSLVGKIPVGQFIDHGPSVEGGSLYTSYVNAMNAESRRMAKAGDKLQLGDVEITIVTSAGQVIDPPLPTSGANPHCATATTMPERPTDENSQSVGLLARFGTFDFTDMGDLTWQVEHRLACPTNRIGPIDLYQVNHHGMAISNSPQLVHGLAPLVAVMNNGATKGGSPEAFDVLRGSTGLAALYQMHRSTNNDAAHNTDEALIANVTTSPDAAHFVHAEVARDGSFTVTNGRTGAARSFQAR